MSQEQHSIGDTAVRVKEIAKPLKTPLTGWRVPPVVDLQPIKATKKKPQRDDPDVYELLTYLRDKLGTEMDGRFGPNYDACLELVHRCRAKGNDPIEVIKTLIDVAHQSPYYGAGATNFQYLLNKAVAIFRRYQQDFAKPQSRRDEAQRKADELFARQQAGV